MNQYPTYLKAVDPDGHTVALICHEQEGKTVILQPVIATDRQGYEVNIRQVSGEDELKSQIGGLVVDVSSEEYNETLFTTWGFDGSNVYRASDDLTGEDENAEPEKGKTDGDNKDENPGSADAQSGASTEGASQSEQPAQPDAERSEGLGELQVGDAQPEKPVDEPQSGDDLGTGDAKNGEHDAHDGDRGTGDVAPGTEPAPDTGDNPADPVPAGQADDGDRGDGAPGDEKQPA